MCKLIKSFLSYLPEKYLLQTMLFNSKRKMLNIVKEYFKSLIRYTFCNELSI